MGYSLYRNESSDSKYNAQRNLEGRTHYADDDSLRFHKSRINTSVITDGGLLFAIVESYAVDMRNTSRLFRPVIFDISGHVISRCKLEDGFKTSKQAIKAMWDELNSIDAATVTTDCISRYIAESERQAKYMRDDLQSVIDSNQTKAA